jgi:hypothetical protein
MTKHGKVTKIVKGYSLSPENVEWVAERAISMSKPTERMSDSAFLDGILTGLRVKQQKAQEAFGDAMRKTGLQRVV